MDRAQLILVEVRTDRGLVGFGEISGGPQNVICDLVKTFARVVQGAWMRWAMPRSGRSCSR